MTINNVRKALVERYNALEKRYNELLEDGAAKTKNSQAVLRHGVKRDICTIELVLELVNKLDGMGRGNDEIVREDSMLGARFLAKKTIADIEEYN